MLMQPNPNTLTPDLSTSDLAQGPSALSCLVDVDGLTKAAQKVTAFEPPAIERPT